MKRYILKLIIILGITLFHNQSISQKMVKNVSHVPVHIENTEQFWIDSKLANTDSFLIKVCLPKDYHKTDTIKYPVLYLTDADAFWGAATDYSWFLDWDKNPIIIIGISYGGFTEGWNPKWRRSGDLLSSSIKEGVAGAIHFLKFLREELIPNVESKYRINSFDRTLFGWSAGGRFALYAMFQDPDLFNNYLALGAPLNNWNRWAFKMEKEYFENQKELPVKLFMGVGEYDPIAYPNFLEFVQIIEERNYKGLKFKWEILEDFQHEYETGIALLTDGLEYIFKPASIYLKIMKIIDKHGIEKAVVTYRHLKNNSPTDYNFGESELNRLGYFLLKTNRLADAKEIFKLNIEAFPKSANTYNSMADCYIKLGDKENALKCVHKTLEIIEEYPDGSTDGIKNLAEKKLDQIKNMK